MTNLYAYEQTNFGTVNLNYWYAVLDSTEFNDDANQGGYDDNYHFVTTTNDSLSLYGYGFAEIGGDLQEGTIEGLNQWAWDPGISNWVLQWAWVGLDIPVADFYAAGQTASTFDDDTLIADIMQYNDVIRLSGEADFVRGHDNPDTIYGRAGDDELYGDNGKDILFGNKGDDLLNGGNGNDKLFGGKHNDTLIGGEGRDTLRGGPGTDTMTGGDNRDTFQFDTGDEMLIVTDFDVVSAKQDRLDLSDVASIDDYADLMANHMSPAGDDVEVDATGGELITLENVDIGDLTEDHFIFVA